MTAARTDGQLTAVAAVGPGCARRGLSTAAGRGPDAAGERAFTQNVLRSTHAQVQFPGCVSPT